MHQELIPQYKDIDDNFIRFAFPPALAGIGNEPVVLIIPSFVGIGPPPAALRPDSGQTQGETTKEANTTLPNLVDATKIAIERRQLASTISIIHWSEI